VTLNQNSVHRLRAVALSYGERPIDPDDLTAEVTSFLGLTRKSNWMVLDQLTAAFNQPAVLFGVQLLWWIAAAVALYLNVRQ
jgi:hypothetical protein